MEINAFSLDTVVQETQSGVTPIAIEDIQTVFGSDSIGEDMQSEQCHGLALDTNHGQQIWSANLSALGSLASQTNGLLQPRT